MNPTSATASKIIHGAHDARNKIRMTNLTTLKSIQSAVRSPRDGL